MPVVAIPTTPGLSPEVYHHSQQVMGLAGKLPAGRTAHIVGPGSDGRKVVTAWDSTEAARQFRAGRLRPALAGLGVVPPAAPPVVFPLHAQIG
jgi:hypothetical protein